MKSRSCDGCFFPDTTTPIYVSLTLGPQLKRRFYVSAHLNSSCSLSAPLGVTQAPLQLSCCTRHPFPQGFRMKQRKLNYPESTDEDLPPPSLLPAASAPSAGTLWVDAGAGSLTPCTWTASSWFVKNAEHRSVSRAWSFSREFCQQKQNIRLAK